MPFRHLVIMLALGLFSRSGIGVDKSKLHPAKAELVSEYEGVAPGSEFTVAVRFTLQPHWHVYWHNAGDSGTAPVIRWNLPEGFSAGEIQWPTPTPIRIAHLLNYGYENEVLLLTTIKAPTSVPMPSVPLTANVSWLVCQESCIPGKATLSLTLSGAAAAAKPSRWKLKFEEARRQMPLVSDDKSIVAVNEGKSFVIQLPKEQAKAKVTFLAWESGLIEHAAPQMAAVTDQGPTLRVAWDPALAAPPAQIPGVLLSSKSWDNKNHRSIAVQIPIRSLNEAGGVVMAAVTTLWENLLFAFLGGLILNLMPCVFPVLSIKILGFVQQAGESKNKLRAHGWSFFAGVMLSFWVLAGVLIALRLSGQKLGWGFHLQSPYFILFMAILFLLMALNLLGVFQIGTRVMGVGSGLANKDGLAGSFFSGVLATIVATPCTAPFMGVSVGYALTQPPQYSLAIFSSLAAGMALPYLLLCYIPALLRMLPRPGAWMETLKQLMAFPLLATVALLVKVFGSQTGNDGVFRLLCGLLVISLGMWIGGRQTKGRGKTQAALALGLFFVSAGVALSWTGTTFRPNKNLATAESGGEETYPVKWEAFSPARVAELNAKGAPLFIDFTAEWCVSCQVNEKVVFGSEEVRKQFKERGIIAMKADWTTGDDTITDMLAKFGRSGVPFYLLYPKKPNAQPTPLPEVLTPAIVLDAISQIK